MRTRLEQRQWLGVKIAERRVQLCKTVEGMQDGGIGLPAERWRAIEAGERGTPGEYSKIEAYLGWRVNTIHRYFVSGELDAVDTPPGGPYQDGGVFPYFVELGRRKIQLCPGVGVVMIAPDPGMLVFEPDQADTFADALKAAAVTARQRLADQQSQHTDRAKPVKPV